MSIFDNESDFLQQAGITINGDELIIADLDHLTSKVISKLAMTIAVTDNLQFKRFCCWVAHSIAQKLNIFPASIDDLYSSIGNNSITGFTVPAINIRTLTFDTARMVFRAAKEINAGAFIFEIATSEIVYSLQRPLEYSSLVLLAAIKEGYTGYIFLQGDHFQVQPSQYIKNFNSGLRPLKNLIMEAINAGYYNIDIDSSTLVDLSKPTVAQQQKLNYEACAHLTKYIREKQPKGINISIGGEIGEVGANNTTPEELHAFMAGYIKAIDNIRGISKMSIQTGTSHGGVILPDGTIAKAKLDFDTLRELSDVARVNYRMAGCVQHGASTLPNEAFHHFPEVHCAEIHLATQFQNIVFDYMPLSLKEKVYTWLHENCTDHKKNHQTNDQFIYTTRKYALGPFKKDICGLPADTRERISRMLKDEFSFLFGQLNLANTKPIVDKVTKKITPQCDKDRFLKPEADLDILAGEH